MCLLINPPQIVNDYDRGLLLSDICVWPKGESGRASVTGRLVSVFSRLPLWESHTSHTESRPTACISDISPQSSHMMNRPLPWLFVIMGQKSRLYCLSPSSHLRHSPGMSLTMLVCPLWPETHMLAPACTPQLHHFLQKIKNMLRRGRNISWK